MVKRIRIAFLNKILFFLILLNIVFGSFLFEDEKRGSIVLINYLINLLVFIWCYFNIKLYLPKYSKLFLVLLLYFLIIIPFSSNMFLSFNYYLKVLFSSLFFLFLLSSDVDLSTIRLFVNYSIFILCFGLFYFVLSNLLGFGESIYSKNILRGYTSLNLYYAYVLIILVFPLYFYFYSSKFQKIIGYVFIVSLIVVLFLIFRRSNFILLMVGSATYYLLCKQKVKYFLYGIFIVILVIISLREFADVIIENYYARSDRFESIERYQEEGRYLENQYVLDYLLNDPIKLIFGSGELFNSRGKYSNSVGHEDRQIHNDYANLLWSGGILALTIYIVFISLILFRFINLKKNTGDKFNILIANIGISIIITALVSGFMSGITGLAYRSYFYGSVAIFLNFLNRRISK